MACQCRPRPAGADGRLRSGRHHRFGLAYRPLRSAQAAVRVLRAARAVADHLPYSDFSFYSLSIFAIFFGLDWIATVPPTLRLTTEAFGERATLRSCSAGSSPATSWARPARPGWPASCASREQLPDGLRVGRHDRHHRGVHRADDRQKAHRDGARLSIALARQGRARGTALATRSEPAMLAIPAHGIGQRLRQRTKMQAQFVLALGRIEAGAPAPRAPSGAPSPAPAAPACP